MQTQSLASSNVLHGPLKILQERKYLVHADLCSLFGTVIPEYSTSENAVRQVVQLTVSIGDHPSTDCDLRRQRTRPEQFKHCWLLVRSMVMDDQFEISAAYFWIAQLQKVV